MHFDQLPKNSTTGKICVVTEQHYLRIELVAETNNTITCVSPD